MSAWSEGIRERRVVTALCEAEHFYSCLGEIARGTNGAVFSYHFESHSHKYKARIQYLSNRSSFSSRTVRAVIRDRGGATRGSSSCSRIRYFLSVGRENSGAHEGGEACLAGAAQASSRPLSQPAVLPPRRRFCCGLWPGSRVAARQETRTNR